ncbi:MAG: c-type cytochrome [Cyanobacteriota/Melainabacteria group bacterium]
MNKRLCIQISLAFILVGIGQTGTSGKEVDLKARGQTLMEEKGCLNCHYVQGDGGFIAPPLNGISKYRSEADILKMLTGPRPAKK